MSGPIPLSSVLRTLARLREVSHIPGRDIAEALHGHIKPYDLMQLSLYLEVVATCMYQDRPTKKCTECGKAVGQHINVDEGVVEVRKVRGNAVYCSTKCKQKAYRKRVTAEHSRANGKASHVTATPVQAAEQV